MLALREAELLQRAFAVDPAVRTPVMETFSGTYLRYMRRISPLREECGTSARAALGGRRTATTSRLRSERNGHRTET